jgi:hypothetical protein
MPEFDRLEHALRYFEITHPLRPGQVVVFDIDGTLVTDGEVEPLMKLMYNHAVETGCIVNFVTAREKRFRRQTEKMLKRNFGYTGRRLFMMPSTKSSYSWCSFDKSLLDVSSYKDDARHAIGSDIALTVGNLSGDHCLYEHFPDSGSQFIVDVCCCDGHVMFKLPDEMDRPYIRKQKRISAIEENRRKHTQLL